ncbi:hypothetical protein B566_EDAN019030 [Ephemera danica]|nr:hypothetical protein B566_EDAN019030 [Ephemera danica]
MASSPPEAGRPPEAGSSVGRGFLAARHQLVGIGNGQGREQEGDVDQRLPQQHLVGVVGGIDEGLEQVNGADADDGRGQLHLQHRGIHMAQPLGLVRVIFQVHAADEGLVATDDDHDQQVADHHHINQGQHHQHDDGLVQVIHFRRTDIADARHQLGQRFLVAEGGLDEVHQFHPEVKDIHRLRQDQAQTAIIFEADDGKVTKVNYSELLERTCRLANALRAKGVKKGDRVLIYMSMSVEGVVAMQACARIGAIHSVVFGGFSAQSVRDRVNDAGAVMIITADEQARGGKQLPLKAIVDEAIGLGGCESIQNVIVYKRTGGPIAWTARDSWMHELTAVQPATCEPEWVGAEHPLFLLYTSGSTGKPKGFATEETSFMTAQTQAPKLYYPTDAAMKASHVPGMAAYEALCKEADTDYEAYWSRLAREFVTWKTPPTKALDTSEAPFFKWFEDGTLNVSYNCLDRNLMRTGFYNEFARKVHIHHAVGAVFHAGPVGTVLLATHREQGSLPFDERDLRRMNLLMPHLQRAFSLQHLMGAAQGAASASLAALDRLQAVMMVVDAQRRLRVVNSYAEQWLRTSPGLSMNEGVLVAVEPGMQERLCAAVAQVARQMAGGLAVAVEPLVFAPTQLGRAPMVLWLMPAPAALADGGSVMLLQRQPANPRNAARARQLLQQLYRLTPREVDIVLALLEGESPLLASEQLEITLGHLRQRLKSIFHKVGVTSQAQLVARVSPLI